MTVKMEKITYVKGLPQYVARKHTHTHFPSLLWETGTVPDTAGRGVGGVQSQRRHGPRARARLALSFCHPSCSLCHLYHKAQTHFQILFSFEPPKSLVRQIKPYPVCKWQKPKLKAARATRLVNDTLNANPSSDSVLYVSQCIDMNLPKIIHVLHNSALYCHPYCTIPYIYTVLPSRST